MRHRWSKGTRRPSRRPPGAALHGRTGAVAGPALAQLRQMREREAARRRRARRWQAFLRWYVLRPLRLWLARSRLGRSLAAWLGIPVAPADAAAGAPVREMGHGASD